MNRGLSRHACPLAIALCAAMSGAHASVALSGTRLIFDGRNREAAIEATNRGAHDVLIQTRLSAPEDDDDTPLAQRRALPFVITTHLQRLAPGGKQTLRVLYQGEGMPPDRESLVHLYVTHVPRRSEGVNQLNIAIRQRLNLFYRPPGLEGDPALAAETLRWSVSSEPGTPTLQVSNPSRYHVSLQRLALDAGQVTESLLIAPGALHRWPLSSPISASRLSFQALTDYGAPRDYCVTLGTDVATARLRDLTPFQDKC